MVDRRKRASQICIYLASRSANAFQWLGKRRTKDIRVAIYDIDLSCISLRPFLRESHGEEVWAIEVDLRFAQTESLASYANSIDWGLQGGRA